MSRQPRWPVAAGLIAGVALDALVGDPRRGHPVAAFGRAAAALEARDYADSRRRGACWPSPPPPWPCIAVREAGRRGRR
jgi:cobalamin biosynthesis protein CobD/CbiB